MARVFQGRARGPVRWLGPWSACLYRLAGVDPEQEMGWRGYAVALLLFNVARPAGGLRAAALQGLLPLNPQGSAPVTPGLGVQHRRQLRHQHQLAGLRRRDDDELPHPDARARRCRTSSRPRPAWRCWWRSSAASPAHEPRHDRQLLGRPDAHARSTSCCRSRSSWRWCWCRRAWCRRFDAYRDGARWSSRLPTRTATR